MLGVIDEVEEDLLELVGVSDGSGEARVEVGMYGDVVDSEFVVTQFDCGEDEVVDGDGSLLWFLGTRKGKEVLHDASCSLGFVVNLLKPGASMFIDVFAEEEFGVAHDAGEGVVEFVGDAGDELTDGGEFSGLEELVLGGFEVLEHLLEVGFGIEGFLVDLSYAAGDGDNEDGGPGKDSEVEDDAGEEEFRGEVDLEDGVVGDEAEVFQEEECGIGDAAEDGEGNGGAWGDDKAGIHDDDDIDEGEEGGIGAAEEEDDEGNEEDIQEEFLETAEGGGEVLAEEEGGEDEEDFNGGEDTDWHDWNVPDAEGPEEEGGEKEEEGGEGAGGDVCSQYFGAVFGEPGVATAAGTGEFRQRGAGPGTRFLLIASFHYMPIRVRNCGE